MTTYNLNGTKYNFPDDWTQEQVSVALKQAPAQPEAKPAPFSTGPLRAIGRGIDMVGQGLTLGASDEIEAGLEAGRRKLFGGAEGSYGDVYNQTIGEVRSRMQEARDTNPVTSTINEMGAGFLAPGKLIHDFAKASTTRIGKLFGGGVAGAGAGTVDGFFSAEGTPEERLKSPEVSGGAILGAATGGLMPATAAPLPVVGQLVRDFAGRGRSSEVIANERINRALTRDKVDTDQLEGAIASAPKDQRNVMNYADVAGHNTRSMLSAVEALPGNAAENIRTTLTGRVLAQPARLSDAIKRVVSDPKEFHKTAEDVALRKKTDSDDLYRQTYAADPVPVQVLGSLTRSSLFRKGYAYARELEGQRVGIDPDAVPIPKWPKGGPKEMTFRQLDAVKGAVDRLIQERRNEVTGSLKGRGAGPLQAFKEALVTRLDELNPDYKTARSVYAGEAALEDAMWTGRNYARGDPEVLAEKFHKMLPSEQDHFKLGLAYELQKTSRGKVMTGVFNNPETFTRLKAVLGKDYDEFAKSIEVEKTIGRTRNDVVAGSRTGKLIESGDDLARSLAPDDVSIIGRVLTGQAPISSLSTPIFRGLARAHNKTSGFDENAASRIAEFFLEADPAKRKALLKQLSAPPPVAIEKKVSDAFMDDLSPRLAGGAVTSLQAPDENY